MKFKLKKKRILKLEISTFKSLSYFLSLCEFVSNFYIQREKIMSWKRWKIFFSLCWFV